MEQPKITIIKATKQGATIKSPGQRLRVCAYCRVSTTSEEQKDSFNSQVEYYKDYIASNPAWINAGIYADEGITGTTAEKRPDFQRMIADCMAGKIDIILAKSISRFARNTVDALNYIRALKEKSISIRFEEEHIDTLTAEGELLITILSSVAQQEVQNTSEHVKKGLAMKMTAGQLVGFAGCLGYDVDQKTGSLVINKDEAEIVRYIFKRYIEGVGTTVLTRELVEHGWKTKYGSKVWQDSTILGILKNEKYKGDLLQGKTFTVDPISKKRLVNNGESDQFYIADHHEPIVSKEDWENANAILKKRSYVRKLNPDGTRTRFSRQYVFSSICECGFCGRQLSRRSWHGGINYNKVIWQCMSYTKKGKHQCPHCKAIPEDALKGAFVDAYNHLVSDDGAFLNDFIAKTGDYLKKSGLNLETAQNNKKTIENQNKIDKLANAFVDGTMSQDAYESKLKSLTIEKGKLQKEREEIDFKIKSKADAEAKLEGFRNAALENGGKELSTFTADFFDTCVEKVVVGGYDKEKKPDPYLVTFVFKKEFGPLAQHSGNKSTTIMEISHYWPHFTFNPSKENERIKVQEDFIKVRIDICE